MGGGDGSAIFLGNYRAVVFGPGQVQPQGPLQASLGLGQTAKRRGGVNDSFSVFRVKRGSTTSRIGRSTTSQEGVDRGQGMCWQRKRGVGSARVETSHMAVCGVEGLYVGEGSQSGKGVKYSVEIKIEVV